MRFVVLMFVTVKIILVLDMTPCSLVDSYKCFGGMICLGLYS
jgi:hypothetical protein